MQGPSLRRAGGKPGRPDCSEQATTQDAHPVERVRGRGRNAGAGHDSVFQLAKGKTVQPIVAIFFVCGCRIKFTSTRAEPPKRQSVCSLFSSTHSPCG